MRSDRLKRTTLAAVVVLAMLAPQLAHADTPLVQSQGPNFGTWSMGQVEIPLSATGGDGSTYTWSVIGSLPAGMSLRTDTPSWFPSSASAGLIGVATTANTYTFILRVTSNGVNTDQTCTLKITLLRVKDNQQLPDAFVGAFYTHTLTALGGTVTWTATEPAYPVPPGMTLSAAGVLSGTPTAAGNDSIGVGFTDGTDTLFQRLSLRVSAIEITTPGVLPNATQNVPYTASVTASPAAAYTFSTNGLPNGLSMNSSGGISGIVNSGGGSSLGKFSVNVTAKNSSSGASYTKTMSIDVVGAAPTLPSIAPANSYIYDCTVGVPCNRTILVQSGGAAPFTWTAIGLPTGMSIRDGDGVTSSWITPGDAELWGSAAATGTFSVQLTVTDVNGATATNTFPMSVSPLLQTTFLHNGTLDVAYSQPLRVIGGAGPYTVVQSSGQLAAGLSLNGTTLVLSGVPTESGNFNAAFTYTDGGSHVLRVDNYLSVNGARSTLSIDVAVNAVNVAPTASPDTYSPDEDTPLIVSAPGVLGNDSDSDSPTITAVLLSGPAHGTLVLNPNGGFTYTPAADYSGADSFTYKATDGSLDSNGTTVAILIRAVNDAPAAVNDSYQTNEDTPLSIAAPGVLANDRDIDLAAIDAGITLSWDPNSESTVNGYMLHYGTTPAKPNQVDVGKTTLWTLRGLTGGQQYYFAVDAYNLLGQEGGPSNEVNTILPPATPPISATLSAVLVAVPAHGALTLNANGGFTYTPAANYNGPDTFTYKANDGTLDSNVATVSIAVTAVNDAPVANPQAMTTNEDTAKTITLTATDREGSALTYTVVAAPAHGTLSGTAPSVTYTPAPNYGGSDSFTFKVNDGSLDSAAAAVSITVTAVNDAPVANPQAVTTNEATAKTITLTATDREGSALAYTIVAAPAHGTLSGTAPSLTYTPAANYNGSDGFTFRVNDGNLDSNVATVSISVTTVNDAPVAVNGTLTMLEDTPASGTLLATDADGDALTYAIVTNGTKGTAIVTNAATGAFTYTPATNASGAESFTFKARDASGDSNTATMTITITAVNDAPVASAQAVTTDEDTAKLITLSGTDVEGSALTYVVVTGPAHGVLSGTAPAVTYTPAQNYNGPDSFTYKANDGTVDSSFATVSITVIPLNDAPVASAQAVTTNEDTAKPITLSATDVEGSPLTYAVVTGPTHGALSGTAAALTYTPTLNYNGPDSFTYKANDGTLDSNVATVSITVTAVNDAPMAASGALTTLQDTPASGTLAATDVDGDTLTYAIVTNGTKGTATITNPATGAFTYTPAANANGTDSFAFKARDASFDSNTATVTISITPVNVPPSIALNAATAVPGQTVTATVTNGPGNAADWVGLYPAGAPSATANRLAMKYLNGLTTAPASGVNGATLTFILPSAPGSYDVRFFLNNSLTLLATSGAITIAPPSIALNAATAVAGQTVTATVANGPGNAADWVGLYPAGAPSATVNRLAYQFLNGLTTAPASGVSGTTLSFTLPTAPGSYEARFFLNGSLTVLATSGSITVAGIALNAATAVPNQTVTTTVTNGPGNAADWVGLYPAGATSATANRLAFQFLNGLMTAPASGVSGATLTFTLPSAPGSYDVRFFLNNSLTLLATSGAITIAPPSIALNAATAVAGQTVTATVANGPGNAADWVGLYPAGAPSATVNRLAMKFLNGLTTAPASGVNGATLTFTLPTMPGTYDVRFFLNGSLTVLATSGSITVAGIALNAATAVPGQTVTATVTNGPGNAADWVGLYPAGTSSATANRLAFQFLNGLTTAPASGVTGAALTFTLPTAPGSYDVRFFLNNSLTLLATSDSITTAPPRIALNATTAVPGQTVTATVTNGPGNAADWVGLYPVGATSATANRLAFQFLNGLTTVPTSGVSGATLTFALPSAPGSYDVRFFLNNSLTLLATSGTITIAPPSIALNAATAVPGQTVTAIVTNGPGNAADWVGLYPAGAPSATVNRIAMMFLNGLTTAPAGGVSGATLTFTLPTTPGSYDVRLFLNGTLTLLATSDAITVTP